MTSQMVFIIFITIIIVTIVTSSKKKKSCGRFKIHCCITLPVTLHVFIYDIYLFIRSFFVQCQLHHSNHTNSTIVVEVKG